MLVLTIGSCKDGGEEPESSIIIPEIKVEVTNITDSGADISVTKVKGIISAYKVVQSYPVSDLTIDPTNDEALKSFVGENGQVITVPYSGRATGLQPETEHICAVAGYGASETPICVHYVVFTTTELPGSISNENSAGELEESVW
jgi:hypothetical protein